MKTLSKTSLSGSISWRRNANQGINESIEVMQDAIRQNKLENTQASKEFSEVLDQII